FIMITADCEREQVAQLITSGVSSILVKPYNTQHLAQHLARAMRHRPQHQPMAPVAAAVAAAPVLPPKREQRRPTLLVVDDMPDNLHLISNLFMQDYRVRVAQNGQTALDICTSDTPPDLLLLDVMMPDMDGFELASQLRSHPKASHIPLIFVTAMVDPKARQRGLELGAVAFVHKPIDPQLLKFQVSNLLEHVQRHSQVQDEYNELLELARVREEIEQINRHDLKAPLSAMLGLANSLLTGGNLLPGQKRMLGLLEDNGRQLMNLIDLSAQLYRIETGRFEFKPVAVDLASMLGNMVDAARVTYQVKELVIELRLPEVAMSDAVYAWGEPMLCTALFNNLLKNACEAAPEGSRVRLKVEEGEEGENKVHVSLENQPAVAVAFRPFFFNKYSSHGKQNGSGLGTYSAKQMVEAQGGSLTLQVDDVLNTTTLLLDLPQRSRAG
ncbi:MAG TPA: response regulator, partial [Pseudomonas sp.]|nr:response regulator [Pseudomonas sp.]